MCGALFEFYRSPFSEPGDCLTRRCKPGATTSQILDKFPVAASPQPLWGQTTIMPVNCYAPSVLHPSIDHLAEACGSLGWRQPEIAQIEQGCVHCVHR